jgi:predicted restriction endonuclease
MGKCNIQARDNVATLTYPEDDRWYDGKTKIIFTDDRRETIKEVLWADDDSDGFENLQPIFQRVTNSEAQDEVVRLVELGKIARRPDQALFSAKVREAYGGKCAVTGCSTPAALEAAHVQVKKGADLNYLKNGILLRADIHALFDVGLITLTEDGGRVQARKELLSDATYQTLDGKKVYQPDHGGPSKENIRSHRARFCF